MVLLAEPTLTHRGHAQLDVDFVAGQSAATCIYSRQPVKLLVPHPRGQSVWAYASSYGGGLVAGDQTTMHLAIGPGACCYFSTQAATRVYRNPAQLPCGHSVHAQVSSDALLVFAPDLVQAFAGSIYTQRQEWRLAESGGLVLLDWFSSGRAACGERWRFTHFKSRNDVFVGNKPVFIDSIVLDASDRTLGSTYRTGRFNCFAMLLFIGAPVRSQAAQLLNDIASRPVERGRALVCSASPVHDGALLRVAGEEVEDVGRELSLHLQTLCPLLGDDPWRRKW